MFKSKGSQSDDPSHHTPGTVQVHRPPDKSAKAGTIQVHRPHAAAKASKDSKMFNSKSGGKEAASSSSGGGRE